MKRYLACITHYKIEKKQRIKPFFSSENYISKHFDGVNYQLHLISYPESGFPSQTPTILEKGFHTTGLPRDRVEVKVFIILTKFFTVDNLHANSIKYIVCISLCVSHLLDTHCSSVYYFWRRCFSHVFFSFKTAVNHDESIGFCSAFGQT